MNIEDPRLGIVKNENIREEGLPLEIQYSTEISIKNSKCIRIDPLNNDHLLVGLRTDAHIILLEISTGLLSKYSSMLMLSIFILSSFSR
jgi:hypothetical protein